MGDKKIKVDDAWIQLELPFDDEDDERTIIVPPPPPGIDWDVAPTPDDKQCKEEHPQLGKELLCEDEKKHEGDHARFVKGEWWEWKNK